LQIALFGVYEGTIGLLNMMGEIDTKPIEPVQVALSLFGEKGDQRKSNPTSNNVRTKCSEL
jgi:hypothetical protein